MKVSDAFRVLMDRKLCFDETGVKKDQNQGFGMKDRQHGGMYDSHRKRHKKTPITCCSGNGRFASWSY